jgi:hypothetical protein
MFMRIFERGPFLLVLAGLVSACNGVSGEGSEAKLAEMPPVACRMGAGQAFAPQCHAEWREGEGDARILILHHPDGGFRRLLVSGDGKRVNVADGSEALQVANGKAGEVELSVGDVAYQMSAASLRSGNPHPGTAR